VAAWLAARSNQSFETSCARIYLVGDLAWKIKRPVRFAFLDFSTPKKRKWALERELSFNRRWSGDIYRAVCAITRQGGAFAIDGDGEPVEWLLEMRRFDPDAVLANRPRAVDGPLAETLGRLIAHMHEGAPVAPANSGLDAYGFTVAANEAALTDPASPLDRVALGPVIAATSAGRDALLSLLETRLRQGFARQCHGDLHLGNILLEDGRPVPFDCIEFNDTLRRMDVLYDVAFPIMDLVVRDNIGAANGLLNAYLDEAARVFPPTLWRGLKALPQFLAVRASVRAHVSASTGDRAASARYLAAAHEFLAAAAPRLIAIGGRSGTGKTSFARILAPLIPGAPGAVVLRSDEIRKRLMGAAPLDPLPATAYAPEMDGRVYAEMLRLAAAVLDAGRSVILDATFLAPQTRAGAVRAAKGARAPFVGVWLEGDPDVLRRRIAERRGDPSDADLTVLERQLVRDEGEMKWRRLSIGSDLDAVARELATERNG
jgi:aminoglycoside phosphotransferase family enzyme/predicted kinase